VDGDNVQRLLDQVYAAALEPALWPAVLRRLSELTGSHGAVITRQNEETGLGQGIRAEPNPDATRLYYGHFATRNVFLASDNARSAVRSYRPSVLTDEHKLPKEALVRSEYYNDFLRRFDVHSVLMFRMAVVGMDTVILNLHRTRRAGQFGNSHIHLGHTLLPHLIRAFDMGQKLIDERAVAGGLATAQDRSPDALFVVDEQGRLRHANAAGQAMLCGDGALRLIAGRLTAARPEDARRLEGLVSRATCADDAGRSSGAMSLCAPARSAALSLTIVPVSSSAPSSFVASRTAIVSVTDPEARLTLSERTLRELFGLTPAEMRVTAALFEGLDTPMAAERLHLSVATVRTHLAHVFDKTGAHSQAELARLLTRTLGAN
jgi:DNA-binding CsgD family transcriptional regulator/PAS domain-containing protein